MGRRRRSLVGPNQPWFSLFFIKTQVSNSIENIGPEKEFPEER
jgi:hypothetical protein